MVRNAERRRLTETSSGQVDWQRWGTYVSDRAWGTVREDYSENGNAWVYFSHDQARSRAYHWGEDGLAGICDDRQRLCFALALWNGRDPISKERLFGLTNSEGNHGEDVKEYYFYLDSTPTHSYLKYLLDEGEFLSPNGIRSLSRYHSDHPYVFRVGDQEYRVPYLPGESDTDRRPSARAGQGYWDGRDRHTTPALRQTKDLHRQPAGACFKRTRAGARPRSWWMKAQRT